MADQSSSKTQCPSCGVHATGKFCHECGATLGGECGSCGSALPAGARFCNECGTAVGAAAGASAAPRRRPVARTAGAAAPAPASSGGMAVYGPWAIAAALLVAVVGYMSTQSTEAPLAADAGAGAGGMPPAEAPFASGGGGGGAPPDISSMTPRERAGRLYDRIMRYAEQGKMDSLQTFAPMAMASFEMLGAELDLDARYDYGRVATETGNLDVAVAQADTILRSSPTHLLGLSLAARAADKQGNAALAAKTWKAFMAAKDAELKKNLTEYQAHAADIESATAMAKGGK